MRWLVQGDVGSPPALLNRVEAFFLVGIVAAVVLIVLACVGVIH